MTLVVFFSRGVSLDTWSRAGILERELSMLRALGDGFDRVAMLTYGGPDDARHVQGWNKADVLPNRWALPSNLYSVLSPVLHRRSLRSAGVFRTNQINGAWSAVLAKKLFARPLVVRCGFLWADNVERLTSSTLRRRAARALERWCFRSADRIVVASPAHQAAVVARYGVPADRISVVPNFVDTALFRPQPSIARESRRVLFVGRLEEEKNVGALIDAVLTLGEARLTIVGDGSCREQLARQAQGNPRIEFLGRRPHAELPALMARAQLFVLPSRYEGFPKALVEAMACGLPAIGTRVPGIQDLIADGNTGILCGESPADLAAAIDRLLRDPDQQQRLAQAALAYVREHCTLTVAVERERAILAGLTRAV